MILPINLQFTLSWIKYPFLGGVFAFFCEIVIVSYNSKTIHTHFCKLRPILKPIQKRTSLPTDSHGVVHQFFVKGITKLNNSKKSTFDFLRIFHLTYRFLQQIFPVSKPTCYQYQPARCFEKSVGLLFRLLLLFLQVLGIDTPLLKQKLAKSYPT